MPRPRLPERRPERRKARRPEPRYPEEVNAIINYLSETKELITTNRHILNAAGGKRIGELVKNHILPILAKQRRNEPIALEEARRAEHAVKVFLAGIGETILGFALKKSSTTRKLLAIKLSGIPKRRKEIEELLNELDAFMLRVSRREATLDDALKILEICEKAENIR